MSQHRPSGIAPPDSIAQLLLERRGTEGKGQFARILNEVLRRHASESPLLESSCRSWVTGDNPCIRKDDVRAGRFVFTARRIAHWERRGGVAPFDDAVVFLSRALDVPLTEMIRRHIDASFPTATSEDAPPTTRVRNSVRQLLCPMPLGLPCAKFALRVVADDRTGIVRDTARALANAGYNILSVAQGSAPGASQFVTTYVVEWAPPEPPRRPRALRISAPTLLDSWSRVESELAAVMAGAERLPSVLAFPLVDDRLGSARPPEAGAACARPEPPAVARARTVGDALFARYGSQPGWAPRLHDRLVRRNPRGVAVAVPTLQRWARENPAERQIPDLNDLSLDVVEDLGLGWYDAVATMLRSRVAHSGAHAEISRFLRLASRPANERAKAWSLWIRIRLPDRRGLLADVTGPLADADYSIVHLAQCREGDDIVVFLQLRCTRRSSRVSPRRMARRLARCLGLDLRAPRGRDGPIVDVRGVGRHADATPPAAPS